MTTVLLLCLLLGAGLLGLALRVEEQRRAAPPLPSPGPAAPPPVTVLLPVRDEEHNVLPCLEGLLAQTAAPAVRVIDDGSTDATAALVRERAAGAPRLALLSAGPLPEGWRGKVNALQTGSRGVETPWLLLTDADARLAPELLERALAAAATHRLDLVSIAGRQEARGAGENLLIPPVFALLDALLGDWRQAAESGGAPVANGQFVLIRRALWEETGGFPVIRRETLDDVAAARLIREQGGRSGFFRAPDLLRVRMYRGFGEATRGWRRNLGGLFGAAPARTAAFLGLLLLPPAALAAALLSGHPVEAALLWSAGAAASALLRTGSGHAPAWGLLYPCDALFLAAVLALGVRDRRRGRLTNWKGREIQV